VGIEPGDEIDWEVADDYASCTCREKKTRRHKKQLCSATCDFLTRLLGDKNNARSHSTRPCYVTPRRTAGGLERISIPVAALVDTNIMVYRFDPRFPEKQSIASELLRRGIDEDSIRILQQAIVEFVAAVTRPFAGDRSLLSASDARREAKYYNLEELISEDFQHDRLYGTVRVTNPFLQNIGS
jgi:predicted nucleic acid-binding protein